MPYFAETFPAVIEYLASVEGLADAGRTAIIDGFLGELAKDADKFLALYPLGPESLHFRYDFPHIEGSTLFDFDFVVDGTHMESGVVRIVYVEHSNRPLS